MLGVPWDCRGGVGAGRGGRGGRGEAAGAGRGAPLGDLARAPGARWPPQRAPPRRILRGVERPKRRRDTLRGGERRGKGKKKKKKKKAAAASGQRANGGERRGGAAPGGSVGGGAPAGRGGGPAGPGGRSPAPAPAPRSPELPRPRPLSAPSPPRGRPRRTLARTRLALLGPALHAAESPPPTAPAPLSLGPAVPRPRPRPGPRPSSLWLPQTQARLLPRVPPHLAPLRAGFQVHSHGGPGFSESPEGRPSRELRMKRQRSPSARNFLSLNAGRTSFLRISGEACALAGGFQQVTGCPDPRPQTPDPRPQTPGADAFPASTRHRQSASLSGPPPPLTPTQGDSKCFLGLSLSSPNPM
ncbi:uncharacterized protein [Vulpes vulpes]|uniref:Uncharacterized protein isoform X1 n=1 Tax=Vulpes vulpes TaxID=9627 RepID=A0ABM4YIH9_VULVU